MCISLPTSLAAPFSPPPGEKGKRRYARLVLFVAAILLALFVLESPWDAVVVGAAAVVELAEMAFWIRFSRRRRIQVGAETLVGAVGEVVRECRPLGQIRLDGEFWETRCDQGADIGERVRVVGRDGLTLVVEKHPLERGS
jgi:membrane protein implicated in regulation of membrane protease activity